MKDRIPFVVAVAATIVWLAVVALYLTQLTWSGVMALEPVALAAVLTAAAGPLVALWLVMVVLEQRRDAARLMQRFAELANQERRTQQQAETLARSVMEQQAETAKGLSAETRKLALQELAANASVLAERLGVMKRDAIAAAWVRFGAGDVSVFVQAFLNFAGSHPDIAERIGEAAARDQAARAALAGFVRRYGQLAAMTGGDKLLRAVIEEGALGQGYRLFKHADDLATRAAPAPQPEPPPAPVDEHDPLQESLHGISRRLEAAGAGH